MKVTLNIENDEELRTYIKDCIKGQVMSIVREDFREMVKAELERKIANTSKYSFEKMMEEAMRDAIRKILNKDYKIGVWNDDYIKERVKELVDKALNGKDWNALVDRMATEKIRAMLK